MKPKNAIVWIFCLGIVVLLMSTSVQAKELTEVNASEILKQIENGEDIFRKNVNITGKLDLSKLDLETVPSAWSSLDISSYGLEKELNIVESRIEIWDSVFEDAVDFSNTEFREDIIFIKTSFSRKNNFLGANFAGGAYFINVNFTGDAYFSASNFAGGAHFLNVNFTGDAYFEDAIFAGDAHFGKGNFTGDAYSDVAIFAGDAYFEDAIFAGDAYFEDAIFAGDAIFTHTKFDEVSFIGSIFTNVSLNETDYNQMNVNWSTFKDVLAFYGPAYIKLIKKFREMEQFEDADAAYYQYRRLRQANKEWSFSKLMDVVAGASCGYGVKPERPLIWAFGLIMVFTLVYWLGDGIKRLKENDGDKNRVSRWAAFYNAFYFSVVTFTTVGYGDWYPEDRYRIVVMIEGVLGWLLLALFIVTLANVMIRP